MTGSSLRGGGTEQQFSWWARAALCPVALLWRRSTCFENSSAKVLLAHLHLLGITSYLGERIAEAEESKECVESL